MSSLPNTDPTIIALIILRSFHSILSSHFIPVFAISLLALAVSSFQSSAEDSSKNVISRRREINFLCELQEKRACWYLKRKGLCTYSFILNTQFTVSLLKMYAGLKSAQLEAVEGGLKTILKKFYVFFSGRSRDLYLTGCSTPSSTSAGDSSEMALCPHT
jgi:hypothetical protein